MSKKQLDTENVLSELTGHSAFFPKEADTPPPATTKTESRPPERETERPVERPTDRTPDRVSQKPLSQPRRIIRRYSFEAFDDQVRQLKGISMQAGMAGETISISEMIREAIDTYLTDRENNHPTDRSSERPNG